jgi:hypothetical protein
MSARQNGGYAARILYPADARLTYPLAALKRPELSLAQWRGLLRRGGCRRPTQALVGVVNAAGCVIAVLHWNGAGFDMLASVPSFLLDDASMRAAAAGALDAPTPGPVGRN